MTVKELRQQTGLSQSQFAEASGFSLRQIQSWEQGWRHPSERQMQQARIILKAKGILK